MKLAKDIQQAPNCDYQPSPENCGTALIIRDVGTGQEDPDSVWQPADLLPIHYDQGYLEYRWTSVSMTWYFCEPCHHVNHQLLIQEIPVP